jgi:hypothetical protein
MQTHHGQKPEAMRQPPRQMGSSEMSDEHSASCKPQECSLKKLQQATRLPADPLVLMLLQRIDALHCPSWAVPLLIDKPVPPDIIREQV